MARFLQIIIALPQASGRHAPVPQERLTPSRAPEYIPLAGSFPSGARDSRGTVIHELFPQRPGGPGCFAGPGHRVGRSKLLAVRRPALVAVDEAPDVTGSRTGLWFAVVRCQDCGLCFTNPRPSPDSIGQFYPAVYRPHRSRAKRRTVPPRRHQSGAAPPGTAIAALARQGPAARFRLRRRRLPRIDARARLGRNRP